MDKKLPLVVLIQFTIFFNNAMGVGVRVCNTDMGGGVRELLVNACCLAAGEKRGGERHGAVGKCLLPHRR